MENELESHQVEIIPPSLAESQEKAISDSRVAVAKQYPRNLLRCKNNIVTIVQMDKETAESCSYALPRDGKTISGPTIALANIVLQQYGNVSVDAKIVSIGDTTVTVQASAWDMENNTAVRHEVIRKITNKFGKRFSEDMIVLTANAAMSIAKRNVIFGIIPKPVWFAGYEAAQRLVVGDISSDEKLNIRRREIVDKLISAYDVTEKDVLNVLGFNSINQVKGDHLQILIGIGVSIRDGDTTVEQVFFPGRVDTTKAGAEAGSENALNNLKKKANGPTE
jgi:hypothetical protein